MSSRFLRLTTVLINVNQIRRIDMPPGVYKIHLIPSELQGFTLLGAGYLTSQSELYTVSEKDHILDYKIVTDWLQNDKNDKNDKNNNVWH
jgi:hypothetical protein